LYIKKVFCEILAFVGYLLILTVSEVSRIGRIDYYAVERLTEELDKFEVSHVYKHIKKLDMVRMKFLLFALSHLRVCIHF